MNNNKNFHFYIQKLFIFYTTYIIIDKIHININIKQNIIEIII